MRRLLLRLRDESGVAFAMVLLLSAFLAITASSLVMLATSHEHQTTQAVRQSGAYQAAEAGIDAYLADLTQNPSFYTQSLALGEATRYAGAQPCPGSATQDVVYSCTSTTWTYGSKTADPDWSQPPLGDPANAGDQYQYLLQVYPPTQQSGGYIRIVSTGRPSSPTLRNDTRYWRAIEALVRKSSTSDFQMLSAKSITYGSTATTDGAIYVGVDPATGKPGNLVHSGTATGNLMAEGTVSGGPKLRNGAKIYDGSGKTGVGKIRDVVSTPIQFNSFLGSFADVSGAAQGGGIQLGSTDAGGKPVDAWQLTFNSNGTVTVQACVKAVVKGVAQDVFHVQPACAAGATYPVPANGAIDSPVDVIVSGTVSSSVTVASDQDIVVGGPTSYANSTTVLGLIAKNNIIVAGYVPSNLTWSAAVIAQSGQFESDPDTSGATKSSMTFNGSVATAQGGSMGLFGSRVYHYDPALLYLTPWYFPPVNASFTVVVTRRVPAGS